MVELVNFRHIWEKTQTVAVGFKTIATGFTIIP